MWEQIKAWFEAIFNTKPAEEEKQDDTTVVLSATSSVDSCDGGSCD